MSKFCQFRKFFLLIIAIFIFCSCERDQRKSNDYILGVSPDYPPFEYKRDGEVVGFDIDLARMLAQKLNFQIEIVELDFASLIPALKSGKVDFIMSGITVTEERKEEVDFSDNYYQASLALVVANSSEIDELSDINKKIIGAQLGSTMENFLEEQKKFYPDLKIQSLNNNMNLIQQLKLGRIDGVLVEEIQAISFIKNNASLKYIVLPGTGEGYSIAFAKNSKLDEEFNKVLSELKKDGELGKLRKKWIEEKSENVSALAASIRNIPPGMLITLKYAATSVIIGLIIGIILSMFKVSGIVFLNLFASIYTSIFRGTPLLVQLSLVYFALPHIIGVDLSVFAAGIIAFSLNSGAYVSEIIRAGIQAVDKGQFEAAQALGVSYSKMMKDIIMPQAVRNILPSLVNEMINLLKESAIISMIGEADLMRRAQIVAAEQYSYFEPIIVAALCYYILVMIFSFLAKILEERLKIK